MVTGFDVKIVIGINANSKKEAVQIAKEWTKSMACPIISIEVDG